MNTTKKGDKLESKIFRLIKREIGQVFADPSCCKFFAKKGYYSRDRGKDIVFDISVEIYLLGQSAYSFLVLIECKNYNHPVPVDDAEEFFQKIQQVSGGNVKGIIAAANSFQEGAINFSKSKGLGLLRYYDKNKIKWELNRSPSALVSFSYAASQWMTAYEGLTNDSYESRYFDCYCYSGGSYTNSLRAFFSRLLTTNLEEGVRNGLTKIMTRLDEDKWLVKYRDEANIEAISQFVLKSIDYKYGEVHLDRICELYSEKNSLRVVVESVNPSTNNGHHILGKITFKPLEIKIYRNQNYTIEREKFTLAHELGHYLLNHSKYMTGEYIDAADLDVENPAEIGVKDIMRLEWQANYFASCILLPERQFIADFFSVVESLELKDRGFGILYLDEQPCNVQSFLNATEKLKRKYKVSREVIKLRLKKMGLLNEPVTNRV